MDLNDRPKVLLLSCLGDGRPQNLTELTAAFEKLLGKIYSAHCGRKEVGCPFQTDALVWLDSVETTIGLMRHNGLIELSDEISFKYKIAPLGKKMLKQNKRELEEYFQIEL